MRKWHTDDEFVAFYNDALFTVAIASQKSLLVRDMMGKLVLDEKLSIIWENYNLICS